MRIVLLLLACFFGFSASAQMEVTLNDMTWTCTKEGDYLVMELRAPTQGWVAVGFNQKNNIVHSDLLMFHVANGKTESMDMYVKGFGNPQTDISLGGQHNIEVLDFEETGKETYIQFRRLWKGKDSNDFQLKNGESFWLVLAYSTHDEFDHHSRFRKHQKVVFKVE